MSKWNDVADEKIFGTLPLSHGTLTLQLSHAPESSAVPRPPHPTPFSNTVETLHALKYLIHSDSNGADGYTFDSCKRYQHDMIQCIREAWLCACTAKTMDVCCCTLDYTALTDAFARLERAHNTRLTTQHEYGLTNTHSSQLIQLIRGSFHRTATLNVQEFARCCWWYVRSMQSSSLGGPNPIAIQKCHALAYACDKESEADEAMRIDQYCSRLQDCGFPKACADLILQYALTRAPRIPYIGLCNQSEVIAFLEKPMQSHVEVPGVFYMGFLGWPDFISSEPMGLAFRLQKDRLCPGLWFGYVNRRGNVCTIRVAPDSDQTQVSKQLRLQNRAIVVPEQRGSVLFSAKDQHEELDVLIFGWNALRKAVCRQKETLT